MLSGVTGPLPTLYALPPMGTFCSIHKEDDSVQSQDENGTYVPSIRRILRRPGASTKMKMDSAKLERQADLVLQNARRLDDVDIFEPAAHLLDDLSQTHERHAGDHFLTNIDLINGTDPAESRGVAERRGDTSDGSNPARSYLLRIAEKMPKGAHLHIHFNSTLLPHVLLEKAEQMPNMYIWSTLPLVSKENFDLCEIQFSLDQRREPDPPEAAGLDDESLLEVRNRAEAAHDGDGPNLFSEEYQRDTRMRYTYFRQLWEAQRAALKDLEDAGDLTENQRGILAILNLGCKNWLISKLVFHPAEAHNTSQTQDGIWEKFNGRTRMMKGLFNYETAFREYTGDCLKEFVRENVQYAEIRPNFMKSNQIWTDDGKEKIDNEGTMKIIIEEYEKFMKAEQVMLPDGNMVENRQLDKHGKAIYYTSPITNKTVPQPRNTTYGSSGGEKSEEVPRPVFGGLKVIYCTPRSFSRQDVKDSMAECLRFKQTWPQYIAGFDLVGEESKGHPLSFFREEFEGFVRDCANAGVEIPFLFHCGETHYDPDDNLGAALSYDNTRRIGHGYALLSETAHDETMKRKRVCIESCPISNEILGLAPRIADHAIYGLINRGLRCTLNSDNGTLFRSTLSHDFYQYLVGRRAGTKKTTLRQCRQLVEWSIEYACMERAERERVLVEWELRWEEFLRWLLSVPEFRAQRPTRAEREAEEKERARELEERARKSAARLTRI